MGFRDILSNVGNPTAFVEYFNDFHTYLPSDWIITTTEAGTGAATEALADGLGGWLLVTNDNADNDADFFQLQNEGFSFVAGKRMYFGIRVKMVEVTQTDFIAGLVITDTTPLAHTDGIVFSSDDGSTDLDLTIAKNSSETEEAAVHTLVDDTFVKMEFYYDGRTDEDGVATAQKLQVYIDDVRVAGVVLTNVPDDEVLTVTFGMMNGEAAAHTFHVDWVRAFVER